MPLRIAILTAVIMLTCSGALSAQTKSAAPSSGARAGAYDALSPANRKVVSAIYEAQLGSRNDLATRKLLTRDEIAALRRKTDWAGAYRRLYESGMVKDRSLDRAIRNYNGGTVAGAGLTVITTANGERLIFSTGRANDSSTSGGGQRTTTSVEQGKPSVVKNAATTADANVAEATSMAAGASLVAGNE